MIEQIVMYIFNGFGIISMLAFMFLFVAMIIRSATNKLVGWSDPKSREILLYYIRNKDKIEKTVRKLYEKR